MTFSSASKSLLEVDEVTATAAGVTGFRGGGMAVRWRAAGGAAPGAVVEAVVLAPGLSAFPASLVSPAVVLGTTLRAIGRGFGKGTPVVAQARLAAGPDNPTTSDRPIASSDDEAVDPNARARSNEVTAVLRGESLRRFQDGQEILYIFLSCPFTTMPEAKPY
jgi:hypothetical protein